jgi:hypothetical protein
MTLLGQEPKDDHGGTTARSAWPTCRGRLGGGSPCRAPSTIGNRLRWLRRYRLAGVVLGLAALYVFWPRHTADLRVTGETAHTAPVLGCDWTAELVAVVSTNGESGTIIYQWNRSDGASSAPLEERLGEGQRETRLRLLWTFHGVGTNKATAKLIITSPARHIVSASFTYRCHERGG